MSVRSRETSWHVLGHMTAAQAGVGKERPTESHREFKNTSTGPRSVDPVTGKSPVTREAAVEGTWR